MQKSDKQMTLQISDTINNSNMLKPSSPTNPNLATID